MSEFLDNPVVGRAYNDSKCIEVKQQNRKSQHHNFYKIWQKKIRAKNKFGENITPQKDNLLNI